MKRRTKVNNLAERFQQLKTFLCVTAIQTIKDKVHSCMSNNLIISSLHMKQET